MLNQQEQVVGKRPEGEKRRGRRVEEEQRRSGEKERVECKDLNADEGAGRALALSCQALSELTKHMVL